MAAVACSPLQFTALLSGGELGSPQSTGTLASSKPFPVIVDLLCKSLHLTGLLLLLLLSLLLLLLMSTVVEIVDNAASLYGLALGGKHVCLLAKHTV
jgi:hypothetical protein